MYIYSTCHRYFSKHICNSFKSHNIISKSLFHINLYMRKQRHREIM